MMKKRNIRALLLCALALAACFVLAACGKADPEAANYVVEKGVITGYTGPGGDITIPATIGGKKIKAIGERAFYDNKNVTSVTISDGIKEIDKEAFFYSHVETVNLGTVEKIGEAAFRFAPLMNLTLPGTVKELGYQCFASLTHIENTNGDLYIPASVTNIPEEAFIFTRFQNIQFESATMPTMAANSFENAGVVNIILPDSVVADDILDYTDKFVAAGMYEGNVSFSNTKGEPLVFEYEDFSDRFRYNVVEGKLIEYVGNDETVVLPTSIEGYDMTIAAYALFRDNTTVKKVVVPKGFVELHNDAFRGCSNLETVILEDGVEVIGDDAFAECPKLKSIILPESVTSIGAGAFMDCTALESVTLSPKMTEIPDSAFSRCSSLTSITLPDSIKTLDRFAFNSAGITSIDLDNVETLGEYALSGTKITEITVPGTVKVIPENCFAGCQQLKEITLEEGVERIEARAFANCGRDESKKIAQRYGSTLDDPATQPAILPNQEDYQPFINIYLPGTIKYIGSRFLENCCVGGLYMLDVKSVDDFPEFDPEAFVGMYVIVQVYFEKEVVDEHMDELDAFLMAMDNMDDKCYYYDGRSYYWIS